MLCPQDLFIVLGTDGVFDVLSNQVPSTVGSSHSAADTFERKVLAKSRPGWQMSLSNCLQRLVALHPRLFVSWVPVWLLPPFCQEVIDLAMRCGHSWQWTVGANLVGRMRTDLSCYSVMFEAVEAVEAFPEAIAFCF